MLEADSSAEGLGRAVRALRHHIADQFDWSSGYSRAISDFCDRAEAIRRGMLRLPEASAAMQGRVS